MDYRRRRGRLCHERPEGADAWWGKGVRCRGGSRLVNDSDEDLDLSEFVCEVWLPDRDEPLVSVSTMGDPLPEKLDRGDEAEGTYVFELSDEDANRVDVDITLGYDWYPAPFSGRLSG